MKQPKTLAAIGVIAIAGIAYFSIVRPSIERARLQTTAVPATAEQQAAVALQQQRQKAVAEDATASNNGS